MDLNYLFHRQQVEWSRANSSNSEAARKVHEGLAVEYKREIGRATESSPSDPEARSPLDFGVDRAGLVKRSEVNPTMAVAITARLVGQR